MNQNQVEAEQFVDTEPLTVEVSIVNSDFPIQSTRIVSLLFCAILNGFATVNTTCNDINAVAIHSAIQDSIAFSGVTVAFPNGNTAVATLNWPRSTLDSVRPLANYQFIAQTTVSVTYASQLEMQTMEIQRIMQSGRQYDKQVGKKFKIFELKVQSAASSMSAGFLLLMILCILL